MTTHMNGHGPGGSLQGAQARRAERRLIASIQRHQLAARESAVKLIHHYASTHQDANARAMAMVLITAHVDLAVRAVECIEIGLRMEAVERFDLAVWAYTQGISYEPTDPDDWYWLNNNLGFSLNQIGCHVAAESHCRTAIRCNPRRHNAHKNLGVALEGQERITEAARAYIVAVGIAPADVRALHHLAALVQANRPELAEHAPEAFAVLAEFGLAEVLEAPAPTRALTMRRGAPAAKEEIDDPEGGLQ